jgi:SAM-dependent methyltransferase
VVGITASPAHARLAGRPAADDARRPSVVVGDYCTNPFPDRSFDGVYCIESACYAPGLSKAPLLAEIARLLVPGGRMVVADPFLRAAPPRFPLSRVAHDWLCDSVALETLGHLGSFVAAAEAAGFEDIAVDDVSANVLPALLHGPAVMIRWAARVAREGASRVAPWRWRNAVGALPLAVLVCDPTAFGYFIVSARRGGSR